MAETIQLVRELFNSNHGAAPFLRS